MAVGATTVTNLEGVLRLRDAGYTRGLDKAANQAKGFRQRLGGVTAGLNKLATVGALAAIPIAAGLKSAVGSANTFNRAMTNVHSLTGTTGDAAKKLNAEILRMGGATEHGPMKTADAFYDIVSGVSDATTHMAILTAATKTATGGQADLKATTGALVGIMNAYGFSAEKATFVSDVLTRTVQTGVLTMDELAQALPQVTGVASSLGHGLEKLSLNLAFFTKSGYSAGQSSTFLKAMYTSLLNPSVKLQETLAALGYESGEQLLKTNTLFSAYKQIYNQLGGTFSGVVTNVEALQGATAFMKDPAAYEAFFSSFRDHTEGATERAETIQNEANQWERLDSKMKELSITVGAALAPSLLDLLDNHIIPGINGLIVFWQEGDNAANILKGLAIVAGAIVFTKLIAGLGAVISVMMALMGVVTGLLGGLQALAAFGVVAATGGGAAIGGALSNAAYGSGLSPRESGLTGRIMQQFGGGLGAGEFEGALFEQRVSSFGGGPVADFMARLMTLAADTSGRTQMIGNKYQQGTGTGAYVGNQPRPVGAASLHRDVGYAMGGYTGYGGRSRVAGMVHAGEYVVPQNGALVLRGGEGGGSQVNVYGPVNVNADNAEDFARSMAEAVRSQ